MINIRQGDKGPRVVLLQIALNRHNNRAALRVDGDFGTRTRDAVRSLQFSMGRNQTGEVDGDEWRKIQEILSFQTYDHIDLEDAAEKLQKHPKLGIRAFVGDTHLYGLAAGVELESDGVEPHYVVGTSNAIEVMIRDVVRASFDKKLGLFRIFAHGGPGLQIIAAGRGGQLGGSEEARAALTAILTRRMRSKLMQMSVAFHPFAIAELHGCRVGANEPGRVMLRDLANAWRVPVTAGIEKQHTGSKKTFRFEGPTITVYPDKLNLRQWADRAEGAAAVCR